MSYWWADKNELRCLLVDDGGFFVKDVADALLIDVFWVM